MELQRKVPAEGLAELVVSKTKHSKTKTEARSTLTVENEAPKLENEAPELDQRALKAISLKR